jgi:hypothetical protein
MANETVEKAKAEADAKVVSDMDKAQASFMEERAEKTKTDANAKVVNDMDKAQASFMEERAEKTKAEEKKHWWQFWK